VHAFRCPMCRDTESDSHRSEHANVGEKPGAYHRYGQEERQNERWAHGDDQQPRGQAALALANEGGVSLHIHE
jgi:hypothetical protein